MTHRPSNWEPSDELADELSSAAEGMITLLRQRYNSSAQLTILTAALGLLIKEHIPPWKHHRALKDINDSIKEFLEKGILE